MKSGAPNFYEILGVAEGADGEVLKRRWRQLMVRLHPDRIPESDREVMGGLLMLVSHVYRVLSEDREAYDASLAARRRGEVADTGGSRSRVGGMARDAVKWARSSGVADAAMDLGNAVVKTALERGKSHLSGKGRRA